MTDYSYNVMVGILASEIKSVPAILDVGEHENQEQTPMDYKWPYNITSSHPF